MNFQKPIFGMSSSGTQSIYIHIDRHDIRRTFVSRQGSNSLVRSIRSRV